LISWNSCRQRSATYPSTKAKLNLLVNSFHKGTWLKKLLAEIWNVQINSANHLIDDLDLNKRLMMLDDDFKTKFANNHLIDNKGLNNKVKKFGSNPKNQHIDLKKKGILQDAKHNSIKITLIRTHEMIADALTKAALKSSVNILINHIDPTFG
jgi:ABC-type phosphate transport system auxiliary subunit